jgi:hypothetical protein
MLPLLVAACGRVGFDVTSDGVATDAHLPIAFVQSSSSHASPANTLSVKLINPPAAGNLVVLAIATYNGSVMSITDTAGNTYIGTPPNPRITSQGVHVYVSYVAGVVTANPFTVTVTTGVGGTNDLSLALHEYSGATALDVASGAAGNDTMPDSGSVTTTADGELYFAATARDGTAVTTPGTGYMLREVPTEDGGSFVPLATEDKLGAAQTTSGSFSIAPSSTWACIVAAFR